MLEGSALKLSGSQDFLKLHQHLRHMNWSKVTQISQAEYLIITFLHCSQELHPEVPGVYVSALAEELTVSVSMISKLLKTLEEKGWILRTVDRNSRRNTFVSLTDLGENIYLAATERLKHFHQQVIDSLGREKYDALMQNAATLFVSYEKVLDSY